MTVESGGKSRKRWYWEMAHPSPEFILCALGKIMVLPIQQVGVPAWQAVILYAKRLELKRRIHCANVLRTVHGRARLQIRNLH